MIRACAKSVSVDDYAEQHGKRLRPEGVQQNTAKAGKAKARDCERVKVRAN